MSDIGFIYLHPDISRKAIARLKQLKGCMENNSAIIILCTPYSNISGEILYMDFSTLNKLIRVVWFLANSSPSSSVYNPPENSPAKILASDRHTPFISAVSIALGSFSQNIKDLHLGKNGTNYMDLLYEMFLL